MKAIPASLGDKIMEQKIIIDSPGCLMPDLVNLNHRENWAYHYPFEAMRMPLQRQEMKNLTNTLQDWLTYQGFSD